MICEDFVMLGRTVPEHSKKHGLVVCSAGYSREQRQFLRVYPITMLDNVPRWSRCKIALRRNPLDSRDESWRLQNEHDIQITGKAIKDDEFDVLEKMASPSIAALNERRASLGIIKPSRIRWRFDGMKPSEEYMRPLFDDEPKIDAKRPRVMFRDDGGEHDVQLRDWGAHMFIKKNPDRDHYKLWSALKFNDPTFDHLFFVGNHNQHRTSWLVISVISKRTKAQLSLFQDDIREAA